MHDWEGAARDAAERDAAHNGPRLVEDYVWEAGPLFIALTPDRDVCALASQGVPVVIALRQPWR